jgi:hypothetical protein
MVSDDINIPLDIDIDWKMIMDILATPPKDSLAYTQRSD